jgi:hypothetical protein
VGWGVGGVGGTPPRGFWLRGQQQQGFLGGCGCGVFVVVLCLTYVLFRVRKISLKSIDCAF